MEIRYHNTQDHIIKNLLIINYKVYINYNNIGEVYFCDLIGDVEITGFNQVYNIDTDRYYPSTWIKDIKNNGIKLILNRHWEDYHE
jgi:hypothetical protein